MSEWTPELNGVELSHLQGVIVWRLDELLETENSGSLSESERGEIDVLVVIQPKIDHKLYMWELDNSWNRPPQSNGGQQ